MNAFLLLILFLNMLVSGQLNNVIWFLNMSYYFTFTSLFQCWLKKQKDTLAPERQNVGQAVIWTSGLIFGKGEVF